MTWTLVKGHKGPVKGLRALGPQGLDPLFTDTNTQWGTRWRSWLRHCATSRKVSGSILMVSLEFFIDIILPVALWPWSRLIL